MLCTQHGATHPRCSKKVSLTLLTLTSRCRATTFGAIMTSISATSNSNYLSPLQQLQNELQSEVSSGTVSSSDQSALSSALTDVNSSLQSGSASASAGSTTSSPGDLQSKINSLIAGEVSSGKLTSAQATELQGVFSAAFANSPGAPPPGGGTNAAATGSAPARIGSPGGAGAAHHGHHGGHGETSGRMLHPPTLPGCSSRACDFGAHTMPLLYALAAPSGLLAV